MEQSDLFRLARQKRDKIGTKRGIKVPSLPPDCASKFLSSWLLVEAGHLVISEKVEVEQSDFML